MNPFPFNLGGLLTTGGKYTAQQWYLMCGENPLSYPQYFKVVNGLVYCTMEYRTRYEIHFQQVRRNYGAIGVKA